MKQAYIVDPYANGEFHQVINTSILMMAAESFDEVHYIGQSSARKKIQSFISKVDHDNICNNVVYKEISRNFNFKPNGIGYAVKLMYCAFILLYYYIKLPKGATLLINQNVAPVLHILNVLAKVKKNKVVIFCHSELEIVCSTQENLSKVQRIVRGIFRNFFIKRHISSYLKFVLLGDHMKNYFCQNIAQYNTNSIYSVDHAYIKAPVTVNYSLDKLFNENIKIGIPGLINIHRGLDEVVSLLKALNKKAGKAKIFAISKVVSDFDLEDYGLVCLNKSNDLLPVEEYSNYVSQMDYILLIYSLGSFKLTASGAVLEAIWNQKPIIALKNEYLVYLFDKFGEMGILCDSIEELTSSIENLEKIIQKKDSIYRRNLAKAKSELLPHNIQKVLIRNGLF